MIPVAPVYDLFRPRPTPTPAATTSTTGTAVVAVEDGKKEKEKKVKPDSASNENGGKGKGKGKAKAKATDVERVVDDIELSRNDGREGVGQGGEKAGGSLVSQSKAKGKGKGGSTNGSGSKRRIATTRIDEVITVESDDDEDLVVMASTSTSTLTPSKGKKKRKKERVIVIDDNEEEEKPVYKFQPLSRPKQAIDLLEEARWPSSTEHSYPLVLSPSARERTRRWTTSNRVDRIGENEGGSSEVLDRLSRSLFSNPPPPLVASTPTSIPTPSVPLPVITSTHPLIVRLSSLLSSRKDREDEGELWTTVYAPKTAAEVLGVESRRSAGILKDWLNEMRMGPTVKNDDPATKNQKRAKQTRHISRHVIPPPKRRRQTSTSSLDDFLAPSPSTTDSEDSSSSFSSPRHHSTSTSFPHLASLILLVGPSGSGKTATVRAIASELGFDLFEVNAGMGRRHPKGIENRVGDLGGSHLVRRNNLLFGASANSNSKGTTSGLESGVGAGRKEEGKKGKQTEAEQVGYSQATREVVIVLEEVDILFGKEEEFWTGVITLVKESKRPVILTCNDTSQIPFTFLSLQQIFTPTGHTLPYLTFEPPELDQVVPFLQHIYQIEYQRSLAKEQIEAMYDRSRGLTPLWSHVGIQIEREGESRDLRRALMELQFVGGAADLIPRRVEEEDRVREMMVDVKMRWDQVEMGVEALSWNDCYVRRTDRTRLEEYEPDVVEGKDELLGYVTLERILHSSSKLAQLPCYGHESVIESELLSLVSNLTHGNIRPQKEEKERAFARSCLTTRSNHAKVIDYLALSPLLPSISTLYLPLLREIFKADDLAESEFNSALALLAEEGMNATTTTMTRGNRRRSSRLNSNRYVRRFEWDHNHGEDRGEMEVIVRDDGAFSL